MTDRSHYRIGDACVRGSSPDFEVQQLSDRPERDEQNGFVLNFKGIIGLRNSKAHSNRLLMIRCEPTSTWRWRACWCACLRLPKNEVQLFLSQVENGIEIR